MNYLQGTSDDHHSRQDLSRYHSRKKVNLRSVVIYELWKYERQEATLEGANVCMFGVMKESSGTSRGMEERLRMAIRAFGHGVW